MDNLLWEELQPFASEWDCVWDSTDKLEWAEHAWRIILDAGLAAFSTPLERGRVVIRFLALAGIFSDFHELAFSDGFRPDYLHMATAAGLTSFQIDPIVRLEFGMKEYSDEDRLSLLQALADNARIDVYRALVSGFGHVPSLFIALWKTNGMPSAGDGCDEYDLDGSIVNCNLTLEKQQAYLWLIEGCEPCHE